MAHFLHSWKIVKLIDNDSSWVIHGNSTVLFNILFLLNIFVVDSFNPEEG